ncbi:hypothetical protein IscW_ISCW001873 [Ixodes scapularis]|uniref:Uncharacterized protein n=1 Tax=Ixodes scapularis TaxID=6945 RepID=B7PAG9_IXOSC|nr:hypothetical protein IscW_ISCW001873 [Ixodes scapularis]|eukprot:XP_002406844.1 hypothetical protein IscW_ISCW001873 [Ixodes scapularis]
MERRLAQAVGPVAPTSNATGRGPITTRGRTATATTSRSACDATSFYLGATLLLSVASSMGLLVGFLSDHWEQAVGPVAPTSNATGRGPRTTRGRTATATTSRSACDATSFYLGATLLLSVASSMGLLVGFLSDHWEQVRFDGDQVSALARHQGLDVTRSRNVVRLGPSPYRGLPEALFLVNLQGGVHRICATLDDDDLAFLGDEAKLAPVGCISYYSISSADEDYRRSPVVVRYPWLDSELI